MRDILFIQTKEEAKVESRRSSVIEKKKTIVEKVGKNMSTFN